jgi:hypothetical protein
MWHVFATLTRFSGKSGLHSNVIVSTYKNFLVPVKIYPMLVLKETDNIGCKETPGHKKPGLITNKMNVYVYMPVMAM